MTIWTRLQLWWLRRSDLQIDPVTPAWLLEARKDGRI